MIGFLSELFDHYVIKENSENPHKKIKTNSI